MQREYKTKCMMCSKLIEEPLKYSLGLVHDKPGVHNAWIQFHAECLNAAAGPQFFKKLVSKLLMVNPRMQTVEPDLFQTLRNFTSDLKE